MDFLLSLIAPVFLHMVVSVVVTAAGGAIGGMAADSAVCTSVTALLVLPILVWMYRRDAAKGMHPNKRICHFGEEQGTGRRSQNTQELPGVKANRKEKTEKIGPAESRQGRKETLYSIGVLVLCAVSGGILNLLWSGILQQLRIQEHFSNAVQEQLFAGQGAVQLFGLGILVPLAEELIFRGLIYTRIRQRIPAGGAIFFSALLFALFHGNMIQMVFAFPLALVLAWLYERSGWFACPLAFHMGANLTAIVLNLL